MYNACKSGRSPFLRNLVSLLILGLLIIWLAPAQLTMASEQTRLKPWRALLTGLLVFVLGWIVAVLIFVLVLALAFFFYWVSLPNLGFFTGAFGLMALGFALSIFWLSIAYFSKIVIAFLVGSLIFKRFIPQRSQVRIWPFLTGVFLYALLASIPYLGWLIAVVTTLFGLGAIWMLSNSHRQPEVQSDAQMENTRRRSGAERHSRRIIHLPLKGRSGERKIYNGTKTQKKQKIRISLLIPGIIDRIDPDCNSICSFSRISSTTCYAGKLDPAAPDETHHDMDRYHLHVWRFDLGLSLGYQKDRAEDARRYADKLVQNQQREMLQGAGKP